MIRWAIRAAFTQTLTKYSPRRQNGINLRNRKGLKTAAVQTTSLSSACRNFTIIEPISFKETAKECSKLQLSVEHLNKAWECMCGVVRLENEIVKFCTTIFDCNFLEITLNVVRSLFSWAGSYLVKLNIRKKPQINQRREN